MPKIKKQKKINGFSVEQYNTIQEYIEFEKKFMLVSALKTYIVCIIFLVLSLLFNLKIIEIPVANNETAVNIISALLKIVLVWGFFFFSVVSTGNLRELQGEVLDWKWLALITFMSVIQTILDGWVLFGVCVGITLMIVYIYFIQGKIQGRLDYQVLAEKIL
jgi:hypothetical protein